MEERKKRTRIRRKNAGIKKLVLLLILVFLIIQLFAKIIIPGSVTLSRYVYNAVRNYYLHSKEFYFNSDKLSVNTAYFESDNWSGVDEYRITVNMNSINNLNEYARVDINYNIEYEYAVYRSNGTKYEGDLIEFYLTDADLVEDGEVISRTIFANDQTNNQDSFEFAVKPLASVNLQNNDYVWVKLKAVSTSPYVSTLVGEFKIKIGTLGMSYQIEDDEYSPYCEVRVTNTLDYYIADEDVTGYLAGQSIPISAYVNLTDEEKAKCHSMIITLDFDPNVLRLDTTTGVYLNANKTTEVLYEKLGVGTENNGAGYDYVTQIQFKMGAEESKVIKFYKVDASQNYTYPNANNTESVVNVL